MLALRYPGYWRLASVLMLGLVLTAALMPALWIWDSKSAALTWFENFDKWIHGITFLVLSLWFSGLYEKSRYWIVGIALLVFGFVIEGCQMMVSYRTADWIDVGADVVGIILGLMVGIVSIGGWCQRAEDRFARR
jgi:hypothetical protein